MKNCTRSFADLLIRHGCITGSKVHRFVLQLFNTATAADGLVINFCFGMSLPIFSEPLGIKWKWKRSSGAIDQHFITSSCSRASQRETQYQRSPNQLFHEFSPSSF